MNKDQDNKNLTLLKQYTNFVRPERTAKKHRPRFNQ